MNIKTQTNNNRNQYFDRAIFLMKITFSKNSLKKKYIKNPARIQK